MLTKEIVYAILDLIKGMSDDYTYTEEHVIFFCKKCRALLLKAEFEKNRDSLTYSNEEEQQQICINLMEVPAIDGMPCTGGYYLRSVDKIPKLAVDITPSVYPVDYYQGTHIVFTPRTKMRYVGTNKFLQNIIYTSIGPDQYMYLKSNNPQFLYLKQLRMSAVFEDYDKALGMSCDKGCGPCDILDSVFPLRDALVPQLIEMVTKELTGVAMLPRDYKNNAKDDTQNIAINRQ